MSIMIMSRLFRMSLGGCNRKLLAVRLADFADDDGRGIYPGVKRLSRETELSERTIQRILADFVSEGILVVIQEASGRPGQATRYDFNLERLFAFVPSTGDTVSPVGEAETGDTGAETGDTDDRDGCHGDTRTVIEPLIEPSIEREARKRDFDGSGKKVSSGVLTAELTKRVQAFVIGDGYREGEWHKWGSSTIGHIAKQFAALSEAERDQACEWRDAFLAKCRRDKVRTPMPVSNYFRDRVWLMLSEADKGAVKPVPVRGKDGVQAPAKPEGWAQAYSPAHAARYWRILLAGPEKPELAPINGVWFSQQMRAAWPSLFAFWQQSDLKGGVILSGADGRLADDMEFIPAGSGRMEPWQVWARTEGLPELKTMATGAYFPKGGPQGLEQFERAVRMVLAARVDDDAA